MNKMYVITRKDLGAIYKMVQGAHALAQYLLTQHQLGQLWGNEYLIFLEVQDKEGLTKLAEKLSIQDIKFSLFYEPDIEEVTALACYCEEKQFKNYKVAT